MIAWSNVLVRWPSGIADPNIRRVNWAVVVAFQESGIAQANQGVFGQVAEASQLDRGSPNRTKGGLGQEVVLSWSGGRRAGSPTRTRRGDNGEHNQRRRPSNFDVSFSVDVANPLKFARPAGPQAPGSPSGRHGRDLGYPRHKMLIGISMGNITAYMILDGAIGSAPGC